jgi:hypothetical protein
MDIAGSVEYRSAEIAPGIRELDQASEMLHKGEYIADEITIGIKLLSNLKERGDFGANSRTAIKRIVADPQARMRTIFIGLIVFVA